MSASERPPGEFESVSGGPDLRGGQAAADGAAAARHTSTGMLALGSWLRPGVAPAQLAAQLQPQPPPPHLRHHVLMALQQHPAFGNGFVQRVLTALTAPRAGQAGASALAAPAEVQAAPDGGRVIAAGEFASHATVPAAPTAPEMSDSAVPLTPVIALGVGNASAPPRHAKPHAHLHFGANEHQGIGAVAMGGEVRHAHDGRKAEEWLGHQEIVGGTMVALAPDYQLPYGDIVALAGDHFESMDQMRAFAAKQSGAESRAEIEYARHWKLNNKRATGYDAQAKAAQEKRYYALAGKNQRHFVNSSTGDSGKSTAERANAVTPENVFGTLPKVSDFHGAIEAYRVYHLRALHKAYLAGTTGGALDEALAEEAFGDHFLTDSFAAGHVRTERASVTAYWNAKHPMFFYNFRGYLSEFVSRHISDNATSFGVGAARLSVRADTLNRLKVRESVAATLAALPPLGLGDFVAGAMHDHDNLHGVDVTVGGQSVTLKGDGSLDAKTKSHAVGAVQAGIRELHTFYALGKQGADPTQAVTQIVGSSGLFAGEALIPRETHHLVNSGSNSAKIDWRQDSFAQLLSEPAFQAAVSTFGKDKSSEFRTAAAAQGRAAKVALTAFADQLEKQSVSTIWEIVNWTPSLNDSLLGYAEDGNAREYWSEVQKTEIKTGQNATQTLTVEQRKRLMRDMLDGPTLGDDERALVEILDSASPQDQRELVRYFGWERLHREIDDGLGEAFSNRFGHLK